MLRFNVLGGLSVRLRVGGQLIMNLMGQDPHVLLPSDRILGMTIGVSVDAQDNVWIVHRGSQTLNNNEKGAELNPPISE